MTEVKSDLAYPIHCITPYHAGLTKREFFAAMALQGMLANHKIQDDIDKTFQGTSVTVEAVNSNMSVRMADALIEELRK